MYIFFPFLSPFPPLMPTITAASSCLPYPFSCHHQQSLSPLLAPTTNPSHQPLTTPPIKPHQLLQSTCPTNLYQPLPSAPLANSCQPLPSAPPISSSFHAQVLPHCGLPGPSHGAVGHGHTLLAQSAPFNTGRLSCCGKEGIGSTPQTAVHVVRLCGKWYRVVHYVLVAVCFVL